MTLIYVAGGGHVFAQVDDGDLLSRLQQPRDLDRRAACPAAVTASSLRH